MKIIKNIEEKLKTLTETEISSQVIIKSGWKLLKKYVNQKTRNYWALVECIHCGQQMLLNYHMFINADNIHPHKECKWKTWANEMVGKTINNKKILAVEKITYDDRSRACVYFKTKCILCGHETIMKYNHTQWTKQKTCSYCNRPIEDLFLANYKKGYTCGAKQRNIKWLLSNDEFLKIIKKDCYYCGSKPRHVIRKVNWSDKTLEGEVNGVDRIDSNKDYTYDNVVPCCVVCNMMKNKYTIEEFKEHISKIYNHSIIKGSTTISQESTPKPVEMGDVLNKDEDIV